MVILLHAEYFHDESECYINSHLINDSRNFFFYSLNPSPTLTNADRLDIYNVKDECNAVTI